MDPPESIVHENYLTYEIDSALGRREIRDILQEALPEYSWKTGDSDAIGGYVSGRSAERVSIKVWTGQSPHEAAISYRSATSDESSRAEAASQFLDVVASRIGEIRPTR